ncbi:nuclear transport factor 2 family protein [Halomonas cupida]|uniref:nuclear transport factor 2 family protein n=1 Tax=Halomonas cupida TaxID=44933 RepID=UPI003A93E384
MTLRSTYRRGCILLGIASLVLVAMTAQAQTSESDETERNEAIVRQAFDNWAAGSSNVFGELLAQDMNWTIHGSGPVAGTYGSRDSFVEDASLPLVNRLSSPIVPEVHTIWAQGDTVVVRFDGSATTTSGAPYENQFVWIFRMEDGLVTEAEAFLDLIAYQEVVDNNEPAEE